MTSTQTYLATADASAAVFGDAQTAIRSALPAITAIAKTGADLTGALVALRIDETNTNVLNIQYEASDKAKSLQRIAGEVAQAMTNLLQAMSAQDDVAARIRAAANA